MCHGPMPALHKALLGCNAYRTILFFRPGTVRLRQQPMEATLLTTPGGVMEKSLVMLMQAGTARVRASPSASASREAHQSSI